ncbi:glycerophosphodiester phosphodiesterase family protein [uncultured Maritalea sp.]|uniref:glycerophosphodiester phosphodiesterase family protein n=1 Tax=uncultured Maritalea sp. TaxID=757249 RepID=UPI002617064B|nr:glycerophosphodiester phosphodiesterase family protein [uncultured Maritalea sp.]
MSQSQLDAFRGGDRLVRIIGHRGARGIMPENTMVGFEWTLRMGVGALEFDVLLTKDDIPVIVHNHQLTSSTTRDQDGQWLRGQEPTICDLTYAEICGFDVGGIDSRSAYGQRFPDQAFLSHIRVPRLVDLLELVARPCFAKTALMLEIKSDPKAEQPGVARINTVKRVVDAVRNTGLSHRTILHSFDWDILAECQRQAPDMPASFLTQMPENEDDAGEDSALGFGAELRKAKSIPELVVKAGGELWCPYIKDINAQDIARAKELGLLVVTWTVNEIDDINQAIELGVDGIVSDYPGRVQHALLARDYHWLPTLQDKEPHARRFPESATV